MPYNIKILLGFMKNLGIELQKCTTTKNSIKSIIFYF